MKTRNIILSVLLAAIVAVGFAQPGAPSNPIQAVLYTPQALTAAQKTQAQTNIGIVGGAPVTAVDLMGTILIKARSDDHGPWLRGNGRSISRTTYSTLYNQLAPTFQLTTVAGLATADVATADAQKATAGLALEGSSVTPGTTINTASLIGQGTFQGAANANSNVLATNLAWPATGVSSLAIGNGSLITGPGAGISSRFAGATVNVTAATANYNGVSGAPFLSSTALGLFTAGTNVTNQLARVFIGPLSTVQTVLGFAYEPRLEYSTNSISSATNSWRTTTVPNTLFANFISAANSAQLRPYVGTTASPTTGYTYSAFGAPQPGASISNAAWTSAINNQIVPQTVPNFTAGAASAAGINTITLTQASSSSLYYTALSPNHGDVIGVGSRKYSITDVAMNGLNTIITLDRNLVENVASGDIITGVGRSGVWSAAANPTITTATVGTFGPSVSITFTVSSNANYVVGDLIKTIFNDSWACVITAIAGNTITCTTTTTTGGAQSNLVGDVIYRAPRMIVRQPTVASLAPPLSSTIALALNSSTITVLMQNLPQNVNTTTAIFTTGGTITTVNTNTGNVAPSSPGNATYTVSPQLTLSANATASGTNTVRGFPFGRGDGSSTFNIPDCQGRILQAAGNNGTQNPAIGSSITVGNATAVTSALTAGTCFIYAGP